MLELIPCVVRVVILAREPDVRCLPEPYSQRVHTCDEHPLSDIEFLPKDDQGSLDVLLDDPDGQSTLDHASLHLVKIRMDLDTTASRLGPRLDDPQIPAICQAELFLTDQVLELNQSLFDQGFHLGGLCVGESSLEWSEVSCPCQVNCRVALSKEFIDAIRHCIKLIWCELRISLDLSEQTP